MCLLKHYRNSEYYTHISKFLSIILFSIKINSYTIQFIKFISHYGHSKLFFLGLLSEDFFYVKGLGLGLFSLVLNHYGSLKGS